MAAAPLVLENQELSLLFDAGTGDWIGLADRRSGMELVTAGGHAPVAPPRPPTLDGARVKAAVASKQAISLAGDWLYTPAPVAKEPGERFVQGQFDGVNWASTPVPSQRGVGDDRLRERVGDFWYRREFTSPGDWARADLVLELGAVDDFDEVWINGTRIGRTGVEAPHHWEIPRAYGFPGKLLHADRPNILLIRVTNGAFDGGIAGPVVMGPAAALPSLETELPPLSGHALEQTAQGARLSLTAVEAGLEYRAEFTLPTGRAAWVRQFSVKNISGKERLFQNARYPTPVLTVGKEQRVIFPGSLPDELAGGALPLGEVVQPKSRDPLVVLWDETAKRGLGAWFCSEEEYAPVSVRACGDGIELCHTQGIIIRLGPGEIVTLGKQYFWLERGSRDAALRGVQEVYREIGLRAPENHVPGLRGMVIYCGHPGGPPELGFLRYGGFAALERYVPVLRKMSIDLLWLLPTWEHGDGKRWNLYGPFDHYQVDHLLGTAGDLKSLSRSANEAGIRLMFDLVPHGPPDFTPLAKAHPEWVARKPDGTNQVAWGQLAFDNHHPGWQGYMRDVAAWGAKEFDAVGARVDWGAGGPLNWNPELGNRPSLSSLAGGLGMNRAIREGYERIHTNAVLLPEEYTGANLFNRVADLTYDAQFYFLQTELLDRKATPSEWAAMIQQFLHDQQQTLPPGALKMRWISNHDTVSWTFQKMRPVKAHGLGRTRALLALCAFIEGVPMVYQGDEDPAVFGGAGESSVAFLSRVYGLRKELPALREGVADYHLVTASCGVFACVRSQGPQTVLVLISFNPDPVKTAIELPERLRGTWQDRWLGSAVAVGSGSELPMEPFQVRVLVR